MTSWRRQANVAKLLIGEGSVRLCSS